MVPEDSDRLTRTQKNDHDRMPHHPDSFEYRTAARSDELDYDHHQGEHHHPRRL